MIRVATTEDVPALVPALDALIAHTRTATGDPYLTNLKQGYEQTHAPYLMEAVENETGKLLIFEQDQALRGFVYGTLTTPFLDASTITRIGQINLCWVDPDERRTGIATRLVQAIEEWFRSQDVDYVDLHYLLGNREAESSWEKLGYSPYRVTSRRKLTP